MPDSMPEKRQLLKQQGALNPRPHRVSDALFTDNKDFFDADDLVQVKYEMLRRVHQDGQPVSRAAAGFGFSRPSYYEVEAAYEEGGLPGILPKRRGPRGGHKVTADIVDFMRQAQSKDASLRATALAPMVAKEFGVRLHPRTIERALLKKKR